MNLEPDSLHEIDRYLQGQLSVTEKDAFENRMKNDPLFAEEVENHRIAILLVNAGGVNAMKKELEKITAHPRVAVPVQKRRTIPLRAWYTMAAAACLIFVLAVIFLFPRQPDTRALFTAYFQPPPVDRQIMRGDTTSGERVKAFFEYQQGHYKEALKLFEENLNEHRSSELLFFAGASALGNDQPVTAIAYFTESLNDTSIYRSRAQWYLCLAYLKNNQAKEARSALRELLEQPSSYSEKAAELLDDLQ